MARSIANDELPFFLIPVALGVRSRRHLVLIRRVEAHIKEFQEYIQSAVGANQEDWTTFDWSYVFEKTSLVQQAVDELLVYITRRPRSRIACRLSVVIRQLRILKGFLEGELRTVTRDDGERDETPIDYILYKNFV
ncbi:hypothetical protein GT037_008104 [Alternaria burnsii]|uniref:Uncharacterized protein n=1 Tax=Alternaria burnsii TaxID=1187904 RepID=A0A8H7B3I8_9PLEO|nr:uncharacterized protein GT037_008104 [Alternaria burnsii]KAF7674338.1 hypothetical protein GT037_008104 [Alternaria burnsii]